ncbi:protein kinase [Streptomyces sp. NPDC006798]|uniref:protein kinase domain-containing protein n=1 Tax=Streptomyces sp. NPDC006798 TaxID=3155462 RepID=UPI0033F40ECD
MSEAEQSRKPQRDGSEERASAVDGAGNGADGGSAADPGSGRGGGAEPAREEPARKKSAAGSERTAEPASADAKTAVVGASAGARKAGGPSGEGGASTGKGASGERPGGDKEPVIGAQADRRSKARPAPERATGSGTGGESDGDGPGAGSDEGGNTDSDESKAAPAAGGAGEPAKPVKADESGEARKTAKKPAASAASADSGRKARGTGRAESEGRLLAGRYRLGGVLGRGGMGTVWRAEDETLGRTVAVKELRFPNQIDEDEKRRLITRTLREAKAIARIRNTSAVTVYDVVDEDDRPWIVMELVEGKSLAEVIREDGILTPRRAAEVGLAILDVLRSAHREGILHRDVKPSNVLIGKDGRVVLTDFGIALVEGDPSITSTGMLVGAPSYISPERARGHRPGPAADLWSLGGLLYASVEGTPPYDKGSAIATLTAVMTEPLDPPKNAGPLEEVIYGLLAKDPAQRLDDDGARALLSRVVNAPDEPVAPLPADATRAMALPTIPPPEPAAPARPPVADRPRGPRRPARPGGRGAAATGAAATGAAAGGAGAVQQPARPPEPPVQRAAPRRAPLTDVVPRRTLILLAVGVVLALLGTILYLTIGRDGNNGDDAAKTGTGKPPASAGADDGTRGDGGREKTTGGTGRESPAGDPAKDGGKSGTTPGGTNPGASKPPAKGDGAKGDPAKGELPAGYAAKSDDRFRFSMAMPKEFRRTQIAGRNSGGIFNDRRGAYPRVQVDFNSSPGNDAAAAWQAAVPATRGSSRNFKQLGIETVQYRGYPTVADWRFERDHDGERIRFLNRGFKVDERRGYSIMVSCPVAEWDGPECRTLRDTAFATFEPKD